MSSMTSASMPERDTKTSLWELKKVKETWERIIKWNELANNEREDNIKRFLFRWISFNGLYYALYEKDHPREDVDRNTEWKRIKYFCKRYIDKELVAKIYSDEIREVFLNQIRDTSRHMGGYLTGLKNEDTYVRAKNLVFIAYNIRCRLFHGKKNPNLRVNVDVCNAADKVIAPILTHLLE